MPATVGGITGRLPFWTNGTDDRLESGIRRMSFWHPGNRNVRPDKSLIAG